MKKIINFYNTLFFSNRFYTALAIISACFVVAYFFPWLHYLVITLFVIFICVIILEGVMLYTTNQGIKAMRVMPERLSNGDINNIDLYIDNLYSNDVHCEIIDEIPHQFQKRDVLFFTHISSRQTNILRYELRPVKRGEFSFGNINVYVTVFFQMVQRRYQFEQGRVVAVYPSYVQMKQYELLAASNKLNMLGMKKIRRIGHSMEFEQIREYVPGDDYRTMNWKATARKGQWMVNSYQDEKAQNVYCVIDKGRVMKMPFAEMTLLDYAINSTLVLSNIALAKGDKAGIITFSSKATNVLIAERKQFQLQKINELLYNQKTNFQESDMESLYYELRKNIKQRSLIVLFTNYETLRGLKRNIKYLRKISSHHLLLVVFFENSELRSMAEMPARTIQSVYEQTIAEKFRFEKKQIVKELQAIGIAALFTPPENLTANTVNKYLEFKNRGLI